MSGAASQTQQLRDQIHSSLLVRSGHCVLHLVQAAAPPGRYATGSIGV